MDNEQDYCDDEQHVSYLGRDSGDTGYTERSGDEPENEENQRIVKHCVLLAQTRGEYWFRQGYVAGMVPYWLLLSWVKPTAGRAFNLCRTLRSGDRLAARDASHITVRCRGSFKNALLVGREKTELLRHSKVIPTG